MTGRSITGLHDRGGEHLLEGRGWILVTEAIGCDPQDGRGGDYTDLADQGLGVMVRLNNGYHPGGTLPPADRYSDSAARCARFVAASRGCTIWIIANETNHAQERPGGEPITPARYASAFVQCRRAIHAVQPGAVVVVAAVAPWNMDTGDWIVYQREVLRLVECDGLAIHTYGPHGELWMESMPGRRYGFWSYRDLLEAVPADKRGLPVYLTEMNPNRTWADDLSDAEWVREAYREIDRWNRAGGQVIYCGILYRWSRDDQWHIDGKPGPQQGLIDAVRAGYVVPAVTPAEEETVTTIRVWRRGLGRVDAVELELYVRGVLPREMPASWPLETLKAGAVAARTYALHAIQSPRHSSEGADVCDTAQCQVYGDWRDPRTDQAVRETAGETWDDPCQYVSRCGRPDCPLCQGQGGYDGRTWSGRLCQEGARHMAAGGATYREILALYYGGGETPEEDMMTEAELQAGRDRLAVLPATKKECRQRGYDFETEWYGEGAVYALAWNPEAGRYHQLKLEVGSWRVLEDVAVAV